MNKYYTVLLLTLSFHVHAQEPIGFMYGGLKEDRGIAILKTSDNYLMMVGFSWSFSARSDVYVVKTDLNGRKVWEKNFGTASDDFGFDIRETRGGDFLIVGWSGGYGASVNIVLTKITKEGELLWTKDLPYPGDERAFSLEPTRDGHFIITGQTKDRITKNYDGLVTKIDDEGKILWQKKFGGDSYDRLFFSTETIQNDLFLIGISRTDSTTANKGWVLLIDKDGNELKSVILDSISNTTPHGVFAISDNELMVIGYAQTGTEPAQRSIYLASLDAKANVRWERTTSEHNSSNHGISGAYTSSGEIVITGYTKPLTSATWQGVVYKFDKEAVLLWRKEFGGTASDMPYTIIEVARDRLALTGQTFSFGAGNGDLWLVLLDDQGAVVH
jgi:hypothetical protein